MTEFLGSSIFPIALTLAAFQLGRLLQRKLRSPLCNPILVAVVLVALTITAAGVEVEAYQAGCAKFSWLLTPATVCLAIPMYRHFQVLRGRFPVIALAVGCGAVTSMAVILIGGRLMGFQDVLTISLLPKSVTTAIGVPLSEMSGGISAMTTTAIVITGILANTLGSALCRLFRLTDPVAQGVALGTSGHVIGTTRAGELSPVAGAAGSLALVVAGLITAVLFPLAVRFA